MRDAFGGVFMIRLLLVFIIVYVVFTALSLNYARAFRVKNKVISYIEEQDITDMATLFSEGDSSRLDALGALLTSMEYNMECATEGVQKSKSEDDLDAARYCYHGIMIEEKEPEVQRLNENNRVVRYVVSTFVKVDLSYMNTVLAVVGKDPNAYEVYNGIWKISGEAKVVKRVEPKVEDEDSKAEGMTDTGTNGSPGMSNSSNNSGNNIGMDNSGTYNPSTPSTTTTKKPTTTTTKKTTTTTTKAPDHYVERHHIFGFEFAMSPAELERRYPKRRYETYCQRDFGGEYVATEYIEMNIPQQEKEDGRRLWRIDVVCKEKV